MQKSKLRGVQIHVYEFGSHYVQQTQSLRLSPPHFSKVVYASPVQSPYPLRSHGTTITRKIALQTQLKSVHAFFFLCCNFTSVFCNNVEIICNTSNTLQKLSSSSVNTFTKPETAIYFRLVYIYIYTYAHCDACMNKLEWLSHASI